MVSIQGWSRVSLGGVLHRVDRVGVVVERGLGNGNHRQHRTLHDVVWVGNIRVQWLAIVGQRDIARAAAGGSTDHRVGIGRNDVQLDYRSCRRNSGISAGRRGSGIHG